MTPDPHSLPVKDENVFEWRKGERIRRRDIELTGKRVGPLRINGLFRVQFTGKKLSEGIKKNELEVLPSLPQATELKTQGRGPDFVHKVFTHNLDVLSMRIYLHSDSVP